MKAVVTGGTRGIGEAITRGLINKGYEVVTTDSVTCNGAYRSDVIKRLKDLDEVDILVNNAGVCDTSDFKDTIDAGWDWVMESNLKAAFIWSQKILPFMRNSNQGRIINISSIDSHTGGKRAAYGASKAGLNAFTKFLAREYGPLGITVNAVAPSYVKTGLTAHVTPFQIAQILSKTPLGRICTPDDVANAVCFLASAEASFITGHILDVNGGLW